jgi:DNA-binding MarR family transcriptional regulator
MSTTPSAIKTSAMKIRSTRKRSGATYAVARKRSAVIGHKPESKIAKSKIAKETGRFFRLPLSATRVQLLDEGGATDHRFRQLLHDFSALASTLEMARAYLASIVGLTSPQYNIAMVLANYQNAGGISVSDVAKRLHVSTAFITSEAGHLEQAGLLSKRPNPGDGRGVLLRLTSRGEALVQRVGPERQRLNDRLFNSLTAKGFRGLSRTLTTLLNDFAYTVSLLKHGMME